jgi:cytochrome P450
MKKDIKADILTPLYNKIGDLILFGKFNVDMLKSTNNDTISKKVKEMFKLELGIKNSFFNIITLGLYKSLKWCPGNKKVKKMRKDVFSMIRQRYELRVKQQSQGSTSECNIIDLMINYENNNPKLGLSVKEVMENVELFSFAANDTAFSGSGSLLSILKEHPDVEEKLREEIASLKVDYVYEDVDKLEYLTACVKELLRYLPPVGGILPRQATQTFQLKDLVVKKGDLVGQFFFMNFSRSDIFLQPLEFMPERFLPLKQGESSKHPQVPNLLYTPFGSGHRRCIGQYLGEVMVKVVVIEFIKMFRWNVTNKDWKPVFNVEATYGVSNGIFNITKA